MILRGLQSSSFGKYWLDVFKVFFFFLGGGGGGLSIISKLLFLSVLEFKGVILLCFWVLENLKFVWTHVHTYMDWTHVLQLLFDPDSDKIFIGIVWKS